VQILTFSTTFTFAFMFQRTFFHKHGTILQHDHEIKTTHLYVDSNLHSSLKVVQRKKKLATNLGSTINNLFFRPPTIPPKQALTIWHYKGRTKQKQELKLKRETNCFVV
jgi:hypothetical protein